MKAIMTIAALVPCGTSTTPPCSLPCFYVLISNVITFLLYISFLLGVIALIAAGIMFLFGGGSESTLQKAKATLTYTIIGLFVAFGAWVIVNTILGNLLNPSGPYYPWNRFPSGACVASPQPPSQLQPQPQPQLQPQPQPQPQPQSSLPSGTLSDAEARRILTEQSNGRITVNYPAPRTSLEGVRSTTIQGVLALWNACGNCNMVITGGTESGHAPGAYSHGTGYKLDLRPNSALDRAIYNRIAASCRIPPPLNTNCAGTDGNIYRYEANHWDVCFQCPSR